MMNDSPNTSAAFQQRLLGFLLIALQAAALAYCFWTPVFSAVLFAAVLFGLVSKARPILPTAARRWMIALAICYIVQRQFVPYGWYSGARSYLFEDACLIAEYFLIFQAGQFFVRRDDDRLPSYLPILAIVSMTFTADVQVSAQGRLVFQVFAVLLFALSAGFFAACRLPDQQQRPAVRSRRNVLLGITLILIAVIGWATASGLYRYARQIEMAMGAVLNPSPHPQAAGFSGQGRLGSVARQKGSSASRIALRVVAEEQPGYLRGRVFDTYTHSQWTVNARRSSLTPDGGEDPLRGMTDNGRGDRTFVLHRSNSQDWNRMEIWPNQAFKEVLFTPLGTVAIQAPVDRLLMNWHEAVETTDLPPMTPYVAWWPAVTSADAIAAEYSLGSTPSKEETESTIAQGLQHLTALPEDMDDRISELADRITDQSETDGEKIAAVERYFLDNYHYQFGIDVSGQADPLAYFLLERPAAHCEYFASGAAVLLRSADVPCRYVTGFVVSERNQYGDYWAARNRDAHAWVEALDSQRGWVLVEATPASGVPDAGSASMTSQAWDALCARWQRITAAIRAGGMRAVLYGCIWLVTRPMLLVVLALIAAVFFGRRLWRRRGPRSTVRHDPLLQQLHVLLHRMDRRCKKIGLTRRPNETFHQFAGRVESASSDLQYQQTAEWYRQLAAVRYGGRISADTLQSLRESLTLNASGSSP